MNSLIKKPSAWMPIAFSLTMLASFFIVPMLSGPLVRQADEGTGAHLFQLWLVLEVVMITIFAINWLPKKLKETFVVLVIQVVAVVAACAPVFYFNV
ncbi:MAG: hypothetical protein V4467_02410 [Patescibacteria group bacterium]